MVFLVVLSGRGGLHTGLYWVFIPVFCLHYRRRIPQADRALLLPPTCHLVCSLTVQGSGVGGRREELCPPTALFTFPYELEELHTAITTMVSTANRQ